ncbi:glycosyltransferase [Rhabdothermincola salaria]|uniref:glycosyltransferase n=1 Tax=Rhabdothermincola salaria TaxID=2903142 RepID=UPI001E39D180|nr:glycosyltransferase family 4 protein [Rhabdothermincola salaria]MCD9622816.1 glycosyltransferase [Rhabdothermincola salaria]
MGETGVHEPARRIAVVTPEWPTTEDDPGAEALHAERLCVALLEAGWTPEVFCPADEAGPLDDDGILVHRVPRGVPPPGMPLAEGVERILDRSILAAGLRKATNRRELLASTRMQERRQYFERQSEARDLGAAVEDRQKEAPFQAAISTEAGLAGLFVPARRSRPHIVRATSAPEAWRVADEDNSPHRRRMVADQQKVLTQAQAVYASSAVVADAVLDELGVEATVLAPPMPVQPDTGARRRGLPRRYLALCGPLDLRHGAITLAAALPIAWRQAPDLAIVLAGPVDRMLLADWRAEWRDQGRLVTHVGELLGLDRTIERRPPRTKADMRRRAARDADPSEGADPDSAQASGPGGAGAVDDDASSGNVRRSGSGSAGGNAAKGSDIHDSSSRATVAGALGAPVPEGPGEPLGGGDLVAIAARAVAVVVPPLFDDVDEVALQALAAGVPVIASSKSGTASLVEPGRTGTVVPAGSPSQLAAALVEAWTGAWGVPERVDLAGTPAEAAAPHVAVQALLAHVAEVREQWREEAPQG